MQFATAAIALAGAVAASPIAPRDETPEQPNTVTLLSTHSGNPYVHLRALNASADNFYLNHATTTFCPASVSPECDSFKNETVLNVYNGSGTAYMSTGVPGFQQVYVGTDSFLHFSPAHSEYVPPGGLVSSFNYAPPTVEGGVGIFTFSPSDGFYACPVDKDDLYGAYQVGALVNGTKVVPDGCTGIGIVGSFYNGTGAFQYD